MSTNSARPPVVLVVDDDNDLREGICEILRSEGYEVLDAAEFGEALALIRYRRDIGLLVTDIVLDKGNGRFLAAAAVGVRPTLKVLFISGRLDDRKVYDSVQGLAYFLEKPFTADDLVRAAKQTIEQTFGPDPVDQAPVG